MNKLKKAVLAGILLCGGSLFSQTIYNFTNCGAIGQDGPPSVDVAAEYVGTTLEGEVSSVDGIQFWTVPATGIYGIEVFGAQGGDVGGLGARMYGEFELEGGEELKILVGQAGGTTDGLHGSGGGGSFVVYAFDNSPLIIAGGGGGHGKGTPGLNAESNGWTMEAGQTSGVTPGGVDGGGGAAGAATMGGTAITPGQNSPSSTWASGGGGLLTRGGACATGAVPGGRAFVDGGRGGDPASGANSPGGFGGGGGAGDRGAGGGGYSGGGAGTDNNDGGGGGGSYNEGAAQDNESGVRSGHGEVIITALCNPIDITASATEVCLGDEVTLSASAESGEAVVWDGDVEDGVSFIPPVGENTYIVSTADDGDCHTPITIVVNELPSVYASLTSDDGTGIGEIDLLVVGGTPGYDYDWNNDGTGDFDDTEDLSGLSSGYYTIVVRDDLGCESVSSTYFLGELAGIAEYAKSEFSVYPNPVNDVLNIRSDAMTNNAFQLLDLTGKLVLSGVLAPSETITLDMNELEAGIYFVQLPNETIKVIKQ